MTFGTTTLISPAPTLRLSLTRGINLLLFFHFVLLIAFDYLPEGLRLVMAAALSVGYGLIALVSLAMPRQRLGHRMLMSLFGILVAWGGATILGSLDGGIFSFSSAVRVISPYVAGVALIVCRHQVSQRLLLWAGLAVCAAGFYTAGAESAVTLNGVLRWRPFSSGLHTSAYVMALLVILALELIRVHRAYRWEFITLLVSSATLLWMYRVRTAIVVTAVYLVFRVVARYGFARSRGEALGAVLVTLAVGGLLLAIYSMTLEWQAIDAFSSGRMSNYLERAMLLAQRSISEIIFGTGPGSDRIIVSIWWWDEKDSHSDFLQLFWEGGVVALVSVATYFTHLIAARPRVLLPLGMAVAASSTISNALLARPNVVFLLFCVAAIALRAADEQQANSPPAPPGGEAERNV